MEIRKPADRRRLRQRLMKGSPQARRGEALLAIPVIDTALAKVRSEKASARTRFKSLCDGSDSGASQPAVNPLVREKSKTYALWAMLILAVEVGLASYVGALTVEGGLLLHIGVGIGATILFCGVAKIIIASLVDVGHTEDSIRMLERLLFYVAVGTVVVLATLFVGRFFPWAELVFTLTSTALSFSVAFLVAICHTLAKLLGASGREVNRFTELALIESELAGLLALAKETANDAPVTACGAEGCKLGTLGGGAAVMGIVFLLLLPLPVDAAELRLNIWVDVSGSLASEEFDRLRTILDTPLTLLDSLTAREISLTLFWSEETALFGASGVWRLPAAPAAEECATGGGSVFTATRRAREAECQAAAEAHADRHRAAVDGAIAPYRAALAGVDITVDRDQTCLFPVLDRVSASGGFHLVITDGAHANCGAPPAEPVAADPVSCAVILIPDNEGTGVATRMRERSNLLTRLYPALTILPSWKIDGIQALVKVLTGRE